MWSFKLVSWWKLKYKILFLIHYLIPKIIKQIYTCILKSDLISLSSILYSYCFIAAQNFINLKKHKIKLLLLSFVKLMKNIYDPNK